MMHFNGAIVSNINGSAGIDIPSAQKSEQDAVERQNLYRVQ